MLVIAQEYILKCLVWSTTQIYSVYCQRGVKKPENTYFDCFSLKKFVKLINRLSKELANNTIVDNQLDSILISFHKAMTTIPNADHLQ